MYVTLKLDDTKCRTHSFSDGEPGGGGGVLESFSYGYVPTWC